MGSLLTFPYIKKSPADDVMALSGRAPRKAAEHRLLGRRFVE